MDNDLLTKQLKESLKQATLEYRDLIVHNFCQRMGDEDDTKPLKSEIITIFKECVLVGIDSEVLSYVILRNISNPIVKGMIPHSDGETDARLGSWLQELAHDLITELEPA